jgi:dTDP-4-dehydrorhamnose 3,5-epimerase
LKVRETDLPGVLILEPKVFGDERGWFMETFNAAKFAEFGLPTEFVQDNHSLSSRGVVRGLHYQMHEPQGKLVRCVRGTIYDVAVDIRRSSPNFGKWMGIELSADNKLMLWVPPRFAHGFSVVSETAEVVYKVTTLWHPPSDRSLLWNDPALGIDWKVSDPVIAPKDVIGRPLSEAEVYEG